MSDLRHRWTAWRARRAARQLQTLLDRLPRRTRRQMIRDIAAKRTNIRDFMEAEGE